MRMYIRNGFVVVYGVFSVLKVHHSVYFVVENKQGEILAHQSFKYLNAFI